MESKLISVIIACYNSESFIDVCLESIVNQTYKNIEIIICDDASTDDSYAILSRWKKKDPRIVILRNKKNLFSAISRNNCINIAKGEYYLIQDIDDISLLNRIEVLLDNMLINEVDFVSSNMKIIDNQGVVSTSREMSHRVFPNKYSFLWNIPFNHPATLLTSESVKSVNGYRVDKETRRGQDYDMFMRLYAFGFRGMNVNEALYLYRCDNDNFDRRTFSARLDECKIRYKGFIKLNIIWIGFPMVVKPIFVHMIKKMFKLKF